eukprot:497900-Pyramimonas_sp.AAC.1
MGVLVPARAPAAPRPPLCAGYGRPARRGRCPAEPVRTRRGARPAPSRWRAAASAAASQRSPPRRRRRPRPRPRPPFGSDRS